MKETAYLLQAALISSWWIGLASSPTFLAAFQFDEIPPTAFWSFLLPDVIMIALLSVLRAYRKVIWVEHLILGAFGYATLYCVNATLLTGTGLLPTGLMATGLAYNVFLCFSPSLFRASRSQSVPINAAKTLLQIVCIWILTLLVVPYLLLDRFGSTKDFELGWWFGSGVILFLVWSVLGLTSTFFMVRDGGGTPLPLDQTNRLVVSGPYRFVRNPMAIAGIGQGLAIAIMFQSIPILVYSMIGAVVWHVVVRPVEERDMVNRFGDSYLAYRERVTCWIPRFSGQKT